MKLCNLGKTSMNHYMYKLEEGYVLIDTGYKKTYKTFSKAMKKHGIGFDEIKYIFITHSHNDHTGFLEKMLYETKAKVIIHRDAYKAITKGGNPFGGGCPTIIDYIYIKGRGFFASLGKTFPKIDKKFQDRFIILDEKTKPEIEEMLQAKIVETPGHSSCSISLLLSDIGLFCGDVVMNVRLSYCYAPVIIEDLPTFIESWQKIIKLHPKKIYSMHGKPIDSENLEKVINRVSRFKLHPLK